MASVSIQVGGVQIDVDDEDADYKPVLKAAFKTLLDVIEKCSPTEDDDKAADNG